MNNTAIEIIDTVDNSHVTSDQYASASSIRLGWKGGDYKDELGVVGSYLKFTLISLNCTDGVYYDLFTGDETRFKVIYKNVDTGVIYWQGFLLPDSYSEPYKVGPIDVSFTAVDGLGRLKGKYLSNDYYAEEKSVIDIITACLAQTGLTMNVRFAPAIENTLQRDYTQIYIDTSDYLEDDRKRDCYDIFTELVTDTSGICVLYQADNFFNIEGINVREFRVYRTKEYDINGNFIQEVEVTRKIKEITPVATPTITMQPPYGVINVSHEKKVIEFPDTLVQEENDGWVLYNAGEYSVYALDWEGFNNFYAYATEYIENAYTQFPDNRKDLEVYFGTGNATQYINIKEKPYIRKYGKYELNLDFKIIPVFDLNQTTRETVFNAGFWDNPFNMKIYLQYEEEGVEKEEVLFANYGVDVNGYQYAQQDFDVDGEKENRLRFAANHSGILNIELYAADPNENNYIFGIAISEAEIKHLNFDETYTVNQVLEDNYTSKKEIELSYADDATAKSKSYRLQKLRNIETTYNLDYNIIRTYDKYGFTFDVVSLGTARIVKENISAAEPVEVIYNYLNTEDHIIKYPVGYVLPQLTVFGYTNVIENRDYWEQWTDAMYKIEKIPYPEAVTNIFNRMFDIPVPKVDFTVKNNVKFNDFINFTYRSKKDFIVTNCEVDLDNGFSTVTCIENYYAVAAGQNLPPVVEAGNDIAIGDGVTSTQITSEGFDPDGFIVSYRWELIEGSGVTFENQDDANTNVYGLTGDKYVFEVTVTDNEGATATDTVTIFRDQTHVISLEVVSTSATATKYKVVVTPELAEGAAINFRGQYRVFRQSTGSGNAQVNVFQNGSQLSTLPEPFPTPPDNYTYAKDFSRSYQPGDVIEFELIATATSPDIAEAYLTIDTAELVSGIGEVNGTPLNRNQVAP